MDKLNKVCTNFEQDFTETEKAQARSNIGAQQELIPGPNISIVGSTISAIVPTPEPQPVPQVNDAQLTIQKNGNTLGTFTANASVPSVVNIAVPTKTSDITNDSGFITLADVPSYTAGDNVKINSRVVSSLRGLKEYSRVQPTGGLGDMVADELATDAYHIVPPHIVGNTRLNNLVYTYKVTDITNCAWLDLRAPSAADTDGLVANIHYVIDLTGEITDDSTDNVIPDHANPYGRLSLNVGSADTKDEFAGLYGQYASILNIGSKYLVDVYGKTVRVHLLGEGRVKDISEQFGGHTETMNLGPNTANYVLDFPIEPFTAYHIQIFTHAITAESTQQYTYKVVTGGGPGGQNARYLSGNNRVDSGKSIAYKLDFVSSELRRQKIWLEFDPTDYPLATQSVHLIVTGTKEPSYG